MGRLLVKILVLVALIWGAWWYIATGKLQSSLNAWLDDRRDEGWQAEVRGMNRAGFPLRIGAAVDGLTLDDPETQSSLLVPQVTLFTPIYWPGHATVRLPAEPVTLTTPQGILTLTTDGAKAALRLNPGTSLQLEAMRGQAANVKLDLVEGRLLSLENLTASVQQTADPQIYDIDLIGSGFAPGSMIREALRLPIAWPDAFEALLADVTVSFDRPWDRSALEDNRPQFRMIRIDRMEASWADLRVSLTADLQVAEGGVPSGKLKVQAQNWQRMLDLATASGALSPQMRPQIESGITLLSGLSGNSDTLDLDITIEDGRMRMGFIPLGNAPRLILR
ncbi:DUF2125 domain-containing protein [uncultured Sulfitobacter sp.]|uniref:DUF2125 domain-containing protein n=1 Tax=uncultured Sulfitobacter sp. TaxID=191468 RepID=UPI00263589C7|nr:DUF2125 domain-containing protein [uncultured Sulfitobacter sp.]